MVLDTVAVSRRAVLAAALAACGGSSNNGGGDGGAHDAAADALVCTGDDVQCSGACVDPMTDKDNCGDCGSACHVAGETCQAGRCVDSCKAILAAAGSSGDGVYTLTDGSEIYCDMTAGGVTYRAVDYGNFYGSDGSGNYTGSDGSNDYRVITVADLDEPKLQTAFVALFDYQGGAKLLAEWTPGNCCFKYDATDNMLGFGSNYLMPMGLDGSANSRSTLPAFESFMMFDNFGSDTTAVTPPLGSDFFTMYPPTGYDTCGIAQNPAFFWKVDD